MDERQRQDQEQGQRPRIGGQDEEQQRSPETFLDEVMRELRPGPRTPDAKKRADTAKFLFVAALLFLVTFVGILYLESRKPRKPTVSKPERLAVTKDVEKQVWMVKEGARIGALKKELEDLRTQNEMLRKELDSLKKQGRQRTRFLPPLPKPPEPREEATPDESQEQPTAAAERAPTTRRPKPRRRQPTSRPVAGDTCQGGVCETTGELPPSAGQQPGAGPVVEGQQGEIPPAPKQLPRKIKEWKPKKVSRKLFLPPGTFMRAVLLAGVDAPASLGAQQTPYPILARLIDLAVLPNDFRADVVACVIVGAAYGDLSAERVYIRAESLACIDEQDRDVFSTVVELKANAVGEDGKLGLRGRVVERRGKLLARAMIVGFLEGLSDVFRLTRRVTWYPFEVQKEQKVGTPSFGESLAAAGLSGFGSAMQRLADYYVEMFKGMYPVIEIEAGREITFVVMPPGAVMDYKNFFGVGR